MSSKLNPLSKNDCQTEIFESAFYHMPVGQLIMNSDSTVKYANHKMMAYFGKDKQELSNVMFGNLFKCAEIDSEHLECGSDPHCLNCDIRNNVNKLLTKRVAIKDVTLSHYFNINGKTALKTFSVSGTNICDTNFAILVIYDITERYENEQRLKNLLKLDLATGATNKHTLIKHLKKYLKNTTPNRCITICMIDFDHFKEMNDKYGHLAGDRILKTFSEVVQGIIRDVDVFGRYGGEEFIIIFDNLEESEVVPILQEIYSAFQAQMNSAFKNPVTFSAGILNVCFTGITRDVDSDEIISHVDKLLYTAKNHGRNRIVSPDYEQKFK